MASKSQGAGRGRWEKFYERRLAISDLVIVLVAVFAAQMLRFGLDQSGVPVSGDLGFGLRVNYTVLSMLIAVVWTGMLGLVGSRDYRVAGTGPTEFGRVATGTFWTFGLVAIISVMMQTEVARGYLLIAFPLGLVLLALSRLLWRRRLHSRRADGRYLHRAVIFGQADKASHVAAQLGADPHVGYEIVGAVVEPAGHHTLPGVVREFAPGSIEPVVGLVDELGADTFIVATMNDLGPSELRELGWALDERHVSLVVAPALTDVAGPRIHTRPVAGLPLIRVGYPELRGRKYWFKRAFDVAGSLALLILLSPLLLIVALIIKLTSLGPVFFSHERIGHQGKPFKMYKFRSMVPNADAQLKELLAEQGTDDKPLFKVENDPRITPIGRFIRKYSIDELPQLFNALNGSMSLVGPRPQVEGEVALYDHAAYRRLMVKPGLTGLWQVSGRSDLSWEDAIRLDLYYVENWSMTGDLHILWRTMRAVIKPEGAV